MVEMSLPGLREVREKGLFDDEQFLRWRGPLMLEGLTATGFRNRARKRRPKRQRRWQ